MTLVQTPMQANYAQLLDDTIEPIVLVDPPFTMDYLAGYVDATLRLYVQFRPRPYVRMRMALFCQYDIAEALTKANFGYVSRRVFCVYDVYQVEAFAAMLVPYVRKTKPYLERVLKIARARRIVAVMSREHMFAEEAAARAVFIQSMSELKDYLRKYPLVERVKD